MNTQKPSRALRITRLETLAKWRLGDINRIDQTINDQATHVEEIDDELETMDARLANLEDALDESPKPAQGSVGPEAAKRFGLEPIGTFHWPELLLGTVVGFIVTVAGFACGGWSL